MSLMYDKNKLSLWAHYKMGNVFFDQASNKFFLLISTIVINHTFKSIAHLLLKTADCGLNFNSKSIIKPQNNW